LRYQGSPYHTSSALHPFISQLERAAGFKADDTSEQRLDKLEAVLAMDGLRVQAVAPLFATLLSVPFGERYPPLALSPAQQRRRTLAALLDQFEGLARRQPILLSFEDAHWADATSLELLDLMVEQVRQLPVLALFTIRPEFESPWVGLPNVGTLTPGGLDHNDVEARGGIALAEQRLQAVGDVGAFVTDGHDDRHVLRVLGQKNGTWFKPRK
jgi:predicted ATPase